MKKEQDMEQLILDTAEQLFLEKGFSLTTTTDIARAAGCNQALVHYYFRTKDKLFDSVFEKQVKLFAMTLFQTDISEHSFEDRLRKKVDVFLDMLLANPRLPFLLLNELITNKKRILTIKKTLESLPEPVVSQFESDLKQEIKKGNIRNMTILDLLVTMISLNVSIFLVKPIIQVFIGMDDRSFLKYVSERRKENIRIIIDSLKPL